MRNRNIQIPLRLSEEEHVSLMTKVRASKMTREGYLRMLLNGQVPREAPPIDYYNLICELRKVGTNLNQLVRIANSTGIVRVSDIEDAVDGYKKLEKRMWQTFAPDNI